MSKVKDEYALKLSPMKAKPLTKQATRAWWYEDRAGAQVYVVGVCPQCACEHTVSARIGWVAIASYVRRKLKMKVLG